VRRIALYGIVSQQVWLQTEFEDPFCSEPLHHSPPSSPQPLPAQRRRVGGIRSTATVSESISSSFGTPYTRRQIVDLTNSDGESTPTPAVLPRRGRSSGRSQVDPNRLSRLVAPNKVSGFATNLRVAREDVDRPEEEENQPIIFGPSSEPIARTLLTLIERLQENPEPMRQSLGDDRNSVSITNISLGDLLDPMYQTCWSW
jgi:hypothetical protein